MSHPVNAQRYLWRLPGQLKTSQSTFAQRRCRFHARSASGSSATRGDSQIDVEQLLSKPTWSVASLLPGAAKEASSSTPEVTPQQLRHLLRLSALPPPRDQAEEDRMLSTLASQLHFVKEIQTADTADVEPLRSLRDETATGVKEAELGLDALREALEQEEVHGKHHRRIRRSPEKATTDTGQKDWNVLGTADRKVGRFFVVDGGKDR